MRMVFFAFALAAGSFAISVATAIGDPVPYSPRTGDLANVNGTYDSNWGPVYLEQAGNKVSGTYDCCGGGTISGTIEGNVLRYRWDQPSGWGHGSWTIREGGNRLVGTWGAGDSDNSGGPWNLERRAAIAE